MYIYKIIYNNKYSYKYIYIYILSCDNNHRNNSNNRHNNIYVPVYIYTQCMSHGLLEDSSGSGRFKLNTKASPVMRAFRFFRTTYISHL